MPRRSAVPWPPPTTSGTSSRSAPTFRGRTLPPTSGWPPPATSARSSSRTCSRLRPSRAPGSAGRGSRSGCHDPSEAPIRCGWPEAERMNRRNPIGRLLRLREIREEQARGVLASAARVASEAARSVDARREEYDARPPLPETLTPGQLRGLMLQGVRAHELVADAIVVYGEALGHAHRARAGWASASAHLKS